MPTTSELMNCAEQYDESHSSKPDASPTHRIRLALTIIVVSFTVALVPYLSSYVVLRNRGIIEMKECGLEGFLYDSVEHVLETEDLSTHDLMSKLYRPLNKIDRKFFDGPSPVLCILFELA